MSPPTPAIPSQVGRYQVVRWLGRGAMGEVLLAHDPVLDRPVAVKYLRSDLSLTPDQFVSLGKRMEQEARASARISHPNLIALHDMGTDPAVGQFLVFEYVEGPTLKDRLTRGGPLAVGEVARLSRQLGGALTTAHAALVLHRDVKPENVILAKLGAKVADFGIARLPDSTLTRPGGLLGTPAYSAPEAIDPGTFSAESDQFSMACTLFEAISAQRAFPGDDAVAVAARVQGTEPPALAPLFRLHARVDTVLARAFSKHPASRFPSCEAFGDALAEALDPKARAAMITQPDGHHRAWVVARPRPTRLYRTGAAVAALTLGAVLLAYRGGLAARPGAAQGQAASAGVWGQGEDPEMEPVAWLWARPSAALARDQAAAARTFVGSRGGAMGPGGWPDAGTGGSR